MSNNDTPLQVPAQTIPVPQSVSAQGRAYLSAAAQNLAAKAAPTDPVRELKESEAVAIRFLRPLASHFKGSFESIPLPHGAILYCATPEECSCMCPKQALMVDHGRRCAGRRGDFGGVQKVYS